MYSYERTKRGDSLENKVTLNISRNAILETAIVCSVLRGTTNIDMFRIIVAKIRCSDGVPYNNSIAHYSPPSPTKSYGKQILLRPIINCKCFVQQSWA